MNFRINNVERINRFLQECNIEAVSPEIITTREVVDSLALKGELEPFIFQLIKFKLIQSVPECEDDKIGYLIKNIKNIRKQTGLKMPIIIPNDKSIVFLIGSFIVTYSLIFYLMYINLDIRIMFITIVNLGIGIVISLLLWQGLLWLFPRSYGKREFAGVQNENDLLEELYKLNSENYRMNVNDKIHEAIMEITRDTKFDLP